MATMFALSGGELHEEAIVSRAAEQGFALFQYEAESGQLVWEWRRGTEPRPQFVTRRVALHWMADWLRHDGTS
jgi:hypothetical protein